MLHHGHDLLTGGRSLQISIRAIVSSLLVGLSACSADGGRQLHPRLASSEVETLGWSRLHASMKMRGQGRARLGELAIEKLHWAPPLHRRRVGDALRTEGRLLYELYGLGTIQRTECQLGAEQGLTRSRDADSRFESEAWLRCAFFEPGRPARNLSLYFESDAGGTWSFVTRAAEPGWKVRERAGSSPWRAFVVEHDEEVLAQIDLDDRHARVRVDASLDASERAAVLTLASAVSLSAGPLAWALEPPV